MGAFQVVLDQLDRRDLAPADELALLEGGQVVQLGHAPDGSELRRRRTGRRRESTRRTTARALRAPRGRRARPPRGTTATRSTSSTTSAPAMRGRAAGVVVRPLAAVRRRGGADGAERLAGDRAHAVGARQPVDGVVEDGRHGAVVLRRHGEDAVGAGRRGSRSADAAAGTSVAVDVLVVERQLGRGPRRSRRRRPRVPGRAAPRRAAVEGVGAQAADQDGDAGVGMGLLEAWAMNGRNGPRSGSIPGSTLPRIFCHGSALLECPHRCPSDPCCRCSTSPPPERRDAARNREALLEAAAALDRPLRHRQRDHGRGRRARPASARARCSAASEPRGADGGAAQPLRDRVAGRGDLRPAPARAGRAAVGAAARVRAVPARDHPQARRPDPRGRPGRRPAPTRRTPSPRCTCATCSPSSASPATSRCSPSRCWPRSRCRSSTSRCGSRGSTSTGHGRLGRPGSAGSPSGEPRPGQHDREPEVSRSVRDEVCDQPLGRHESTVAGAGVPDSMS